MTAGELDVVLDGIDPDRLEITRRPQMGVHVVVQVPEHYVSIIPEHDILGMVERATGPGWAHGDWDTLPGIVELALLDGTGREVLGDPLRRVPFALAAEILRRAIAGDVSAFDDPDAP